MMGSLWCPVLWTDSYSGMYKCVGAYNMNVVPRSHSLGCCPPCFLRPGLTDLDWLVQLGWLVNQQAQEIHDSTEIISPCYLIWPFHMCSIERRQILRLEWQGLYTLSCLSSSKPALCDVLG